MKGSIIFLLLALSISCGKNINRLDMTNEQQIVLENSTIKGNIKADADTIKYYAENQGIIYSLDTLLNEVGLSIKTYCLNDSAVYQRTYSGQSAHDKNIIAFAVSHNFATKIELVKPNKRIMVEVKKEVFCDSLPGDFMSICSMWSNKLYNYENGDVIFYAKLAEPDTDYQYGIYYTITEDGKIKILKVEDESYNGSEDDF